MMGGAVVLELSLVTIKIVFRTWKKDARGRYQSTDTDDLEVSTHVDNNYDVVIPLQIVNDPDNDARDQEDSESDEISENTLVR